MYCTSAELGYSADCGGNNPRSDPYPPSEHPGQGASLLGEQLVTGVTCSVTSPGESGMLWRWDLWLSRCVMPGRPAVVGAVGGVMRSLMSSCPGVDGARGRWQGREWRGMIHGTAQRRECGRGAEGGSSGLALG